MTKARVQAAESNRSSGFTLLELLIVIVIISIVVASADFAFFPSRKLTPDKAARAITALIRLSLDEAIFNKREFALEFSTVAVRVLALDERDNNWKPVVKPDSLRTIVDLNDLAAHILIEQKSITLSGSKWRGKPQVMLLSSSETTPFEVSLSRKKGQGSVAKVRLDAYGRVKIDYK